MRQYASRLVILTMSLVLACVSVVHAQIAGGGVVNPGGGGGTSGSVTISVTPADTLPMGLEVTLEAMPTNIQNPTFQWSGACEGTPPWRNILPPGPIIKESLPYPGDQTYRVDVSGVTKDQIVHFKEPNEVELSVTPVQAKWDSQRNFFIVQQIIVAKLKWNTQPLGPKAEVCFKELAVQRAEPSLLANYPELSVFTRKVDNWIPPTCVKDFHGCPEFPNDVTGSWKSPELKDRNWYFITPKVMGVLQSLPSGKLLARRVHQYLFYGGCCNTFPWPPLTKSFNVEVKLEQSTTPIPGTNPVQYFKLPVITIVP